MASTECNSKRPKDWIQSLSLKRRQQVLDSSSIKSFTKLPCHHLNIRRLRAERRLQLAVLAPGLWAPRSPWSVATSATYRKALIKRTKVTKEWICQKFSCKRLNHRIHVSAQSAHWLTIIKTYRSLGQRTHEGFGHNPNPTTSAEQPQNHVINSMSLSQSRFADSSPTKNI